MNITPASQPSEEAAPASPDENEVTVDPAVRRQFAHLYAPVSGERFPIPAVRLSDINPRYLRQVVFYPTHEQPGTIVIDPHNHFLYLVQGGGRALRYGVGVGRQGFGWSGAATIHNKQEWPDWYPPKEMIQRQPELRRQMSELQSGLGMPGGPRNPLGSRAMYLSLPKTRFERTGDAIRPRLHVRRCPRRARSGAGLAHPFRAKHEDATHCNRWRISQESASGALR